MGSRTVPDLSYEPLKSTSLNDWTAVFSYDTVNFPPGAALQLPTSNFSCQFLTDFLKTGQSYSRATIWAHDQFFFPSLKFSLYSCGFVIMGHPLWQEGGSVIYSCCWSSPAQSLSCPHSGGPDSRLYLPHRQGSPVIPPGNGILTLDYQLTSEVVDVKLLPMVSRLPSESHDQIFILYVTMWVYLCGTPSLTRGWVCTLLVQSLLGLARAVTLGSKSRRTHDHIITVSFETSQTWRARSPYLYPPGTGWPSYTPEHWVTFLF
jgi:hypothetical protein